MCRVTIIKIYYPQASSVFWMHQTIDEGTPHSDKKRSGLCRICRPWMNVIYPSLDFVAQVLYEVQVQAMAVYECCAVRGSFLWTWHYGHGRCCVGTRDSDYEQSMTQYEALTPGRCSCYRCFRRPSVHIIMLLPHHEDSLSLHHKAINMIFCHRNAIQTFVRVEYTLPLLILSSDVFEHFTHVPLDNDL